MKILHLSSEKSWRGGEQQIAYLIEELSKLGVQSIVACRKSSEFESYCRIKNIPYTSLPFANSFDIKTAIGIKNFAAGQKADIIHLHSGKSHALGVLAASLGAKMPLVLSRRVDFPVKKGWFSQWKYNHPSIRRILCVSDKINEIISQNIKFPEKCVTVHSGIDMTRFSPDLKTGFLRKKYNLSANTVLVGNASAIAPHKDYYTFVDTAEKILAQRTDIRFFIIGDGPLTQKIRDYVTSKKLENHIIFTGFLKNIPEVLPELDIFLITSKTEGLGTTVLDAFLSRIPVVATKAGGIPEMVVHKKTGLLADVGDAQALAANISSILGDENLKETIVEGALKKVREFSKENTARATFNEYQKIIKPASSF